MKASMHVGRVGAKGNVFKVSHNDRAFNLDKAEHIDQARTNENTYVKCLKPNPYEAGSLEEYEKEVYKSLFGAGLEAKNERYRKQGHSERVKTIEQYYAGKKTCPQEVILSVGNMNEHIEASQLRKIVNDYLSETAKKYKNNVLVLDCSTHVDESTPHVHMRRVFTSIDKDGNLIVNQAQALRNMGYERPDTDKPEDRYNNSAITFLKEDRELFHEVCKKHGLELDLEVVSGKKHKEKLEYQVEQLEKQKQKLEKEVPQVFDEPLKNELATDFIERTDLRAKFVQNRKENAKLINENDELKHDNAVINIELAEERQKRFSLGERNKRLERASKRFKWLENGLERLKHTNPTYYNQVVGVLSFVTELGKKQIEKTRQEQEEEQER